MQNQKTEEKESVKAVGFFCGADGLTEIIVANDNATSEEEKNSD